MAIKRNAGVIDINEFENHLKASTRQEGYLEIIMFTPDPNIRLRSITSDDKLDICNIDTVGDIRKYTNITVATLEENLWLLNSRFPVYQNGKIDGYISNSMSDKDGEFETNPKITVQLNNVAEKVENFSVILNPAVPTGYPKSVNIYCYDKDDNQIGTFKKELQWEENTGDVDENEEPIYTTKYLETLPSINFDFNLNNLYKVECEFVGTRFGNRRIRVSSIMFGKTLYLNQDQVLNVEYTDKTSFVPDTLPSRTFSFDLNNYDSTYNIDNPDNGYIALNKQTRVQFRNGYNVAGYEYDEDGYVKFNEFNLPIVNNEEGLEEIEWDDWKEVRLLNVSANADESATFECGSILDAMEEIYTQEVFEGNDRRVEDIVNNILNFQNLDYSIIEWSTDDNLKSYKDYLIDTVLPDLTCRELLQRIAFSVGATILIKDNGHIKFANLNLNNPGSFTRNFEWNYMDFESIPAAEQLESINDASELSLPKYYSTLKRDGNVSFNGRVDQTIITTVQCTALSQEVTYSECLAHGARISEKDTSGATLQDDYHLYARRGIINLRGLQAGDTAQIDIIGYPIETKTVQARNTTISTLVLETDLMKEDPKNNKNEEMIRSKYAEWYKKKFKYTITTRGEPLVNAGDYGVIQTQFSEQMPVYILQNHWTFDGTWAGDMEVIALG